MPFEITWLFNRIILYIKYKRQVNKHRLVSRIYILGLEGKVDRFNYDYSKLKRDPLSNYS